MNVRTIVLLYDILYMYILALLLMCNLNVSGTLQQFEPSVVIWKGNLQMSDFGRDM